MMKKSAKKPALPPASRAASHRHTKIVASLGPATDELAVMEGMIRAGLDVARVNFSHGAAADHMRRAKLMRERAAACNRAVGLLADLQGPKIRIANFRDGAVQLRDGAAFTLDVQLGGDDGDAAAVGVTYKALPRDVKAGDLLMLDDGNIALRVMRVRGGKVHTRVTAGGVLSDSKGINLAGGGLSAPALTAKDRADIKLAGKLQADYLGLSFVRNADDVRRARRLFTAAGGNGGIVAKIERAEALANIEEIIATADAVMIARGDLGVEIGNAELPGVQKRIITAARGHNSIVIVATQMMQSMVVNPQPTRAEVLDVANAVLDGTDAVMLSAETATGRHPVRVVSAMHHICRGAESHRISTTDGVEVDAAADRIAGTEQAIAVATMFTAHHHNLAAIVALTESGATARWMSRINSGIPIYAITRHVATQRRVTLYKGVYPVAHDVNARSDHRIDRQIVTELLRRKSVRKGDRIAVTRGDLTGVSGGTNTMKILRVE